MSIQSIFRWGGISAILSAFLLLAATVLLLTSQANPTGSVTSGIFFYTGLLAAIPALITVYAAQFEQAGKLGFTGLVLTLLGAIIYTTPVYIAVAGASEVEGWHNLWEFAMLRVPILLFGPPLFMIGLILIGLATMRAGIFQRGAGILLAAGGFVWLVAFILSNPAILLAAILIIGLGMVWLGSALVFNRRLDYSSHQVA